MGLNVPCQQIFLFKKALDGKAGLNFIIKQWAEGIKEGTTALFELTEWYPWLPDWVWESVRGQTGNKVGFEWHYKEMLEKMTKEPKESEVQNTYIIMPPQTNVHGTAFGGQIMAWMDETAAIAATRHCHQPSVTVSVDEVQFTKPIRMGYIVILKAKVNYTGRSSMEVGVRVCSEDPITGKRQHCLSGYLTFVAVNKDGKPTPVIQLKPVTTEDKRRFEEGKNRRNLRLERKAALQRG
jgi:acyl-CoA hydrolase